MSIGWFSSVFYCNKTLEVYFSLHYFVLLDFGVDLDISSWDLPKQHLNKGMIFGWINCSDMNTCTGRSLIKCFTSHKPVPSRSASLPWTISSVRNPSQIRQGIQSTLKITPCPRTLNREDYLFQRNPFETLKTSRDLLTFGLKSCLWYCMFRFARTRCWWHYRQHPNTHTHNALVLKKPLVMKG